MSDILADYRIWKSQQEERIGTHSKRCHLWPRHERCMIHRLAAEVERLRDLADKRGSIAVKRRREIERLRTAIRRLAEQDATLSVCEGNVTVAMDAALTEEEREAIEWAVSAAEDCQHPADDTLRCLLQRHFPAPENPPAQDNRPRASENLPSGNDAPNLHSNQSEVSVPCTFTAQIEQ